MIVVKIIQVLYYVLEIEFFNHSNN